MTHEAAQTAVMPKFCKATRRSKAKYRPTKAERVIRAEALKLRLKPSESKAKRSKLNDLVKNKKKAERKRRTTMFLDSVATTNDAEPERTPTPDPEGPGDWCC
jgi:hypothetical protein